MSRSTIIRYGVAVSAVLLTTVVKEFLETVCGPGPPLLWFVPAMTVVAWYGGLGPGLLCTALAFGVSTYRYMEPIRTIMVNGGNDRIRLFLFLFQGTVSSVLMEKLHAARRLSEASRRQTETYRDVLQQTSVELRRERDFARQLIEAAQAIVLVLDRGGRVRDVNPFYERVTGRPTDGLLGADWFEAAVPEHDRPRARAAFAAALNGAGESRVLHAIVAEDAQEREMLWANRALSAAEDEGGGLLAIGHDLTELKDAQGRALQAERLAAIGQMTAGLAHESRNALQRAQSCLEMLTRRIGDRPEALDLVDGIQEAQDDLNRLYEQVGAYAAPIVLERRACALGEILHDAWEWLAPAREGRDARLELETPTAGAPAPVFQADRFRLMQVFRNVLDNALSACDDPVRMAIAWADVELEGVPAVRLEVRDNGPGLSPEQRRRIFEPFYTTKVKGTGLGMAITRRIVEAHGGRIEVGGAQEPGRGTVVRIFLPRGGA